MIKTKQFSGITILEKDKALERAVKSQKLDNILDYEKDNIDLAISYCDKKRCAIDIGASYGIISNRLALNFNNVKSFEIVNDIRHCLKINISNFQLEHVTVYDCGLGEKEQLVAIEYAEGKTTKTHVKQAPGNFLIKPLDSFCFENVDFIKMDVEGFEAFVIAGAIETIKKYKPVILYERKEHSSRYDKEKNNVLDTLSNLGYKELEYVGSKNALIGVK